MAKIAPHTDVVVQKIPIPSAEGNHGLFIEPTLQLAHIACEGNSKLLFLDLRSKQVVSQFDVGQGPDVLA